MKRGKEEPGMVDVVVAVAAVCLAVIVLGLIFPASRRFAIVFGSFVFVALTAAGIGRLPPTPTAKRSARLDDGRPTASARGR